jgi:SAM-dependent methyltransferase
MKTRQLKMMISEEVERLNDDAERFMKRHDFPRDSRVKWFQDDSHWRIYSIARESSGRSRVDTYRLDAEGNKVDYGHMPLPRFLRETRDMDELEQEIPVGRAMLRDYRTGARIRAIRMLGVRRGQAVLEIGPGGSNLHHQLNAAGGRVVLADFSKHVLWLNGEAKGMEKVAAETSSLPFRAKFDRAICTFVLLRHPSPVDVMKSIAASLKPGGVFVAAEETPLYRLMKEQAELAGLVVQPRSISVRKIEGSYFTIMRATKPK